MLLPSILLCLLLFTGGSVGKRCNEGGKTSGSCDRLKDKRYQIRGVDVLPMWKFVLGKDIRRTQSSSTRLNYNRAIDGFAESVHAIPPMPDREIDEEEQQEEVFDRRAHGVKTVEYNQDPVDSYERAIAGDEFDDRPPVDPVKLAQEDTGAEEDITKVEINYDKRGNNGPKMTPVPAAANSLATVEILYTASTSPVASSSFPTPSPTLSPPSSTHSQYVTIPTAPPTAVNLHAQFNPVQPAQPVHQIPYERPEIPANAYNLENGENLAIVPPPPPPDSEVVRLPPRETPSAPAPMIPLPSQMSQVESIHAAVAEASERHVTTGVPPVTVPAVAPTITISPIHEAPVTLEPSKMERILARVVVMDNLPQIIRYPPRQQRPAEITKPWWMNTTPTTNWWAQKVVTPYPTAPVTFDKVWWTTTTVPSATSVAATANPARLSSAANIAADQYSWQIPTVNSTVNPAPATTPKPAAPTTSWDGEAEVLEETEALERKRNQEQGLSRRRADKAEIVKGVDSSEEIGTEEDYEDAEKEKMEKMESGNPHESSSTFSGGARGNDATLQKARKFLKGGKQRKGGRKQEGEVTHDEEETEENEHKGGKEDGEEDADALPRPKGRKPHRMREEHEEAEDHTVKPKKKLKSRGGSLGSSGKVGQEKSSTLRGSGAGRESLGGGGGRESLGGRMRKPGKKRPLERERDGEQAEEEPEEEKDGSERTEEVHGKGGRGRGKGGRSRVLKGGGGSKKKEEKEEEVEDFDDKEGKEAGDEYEEFAETTTAAPADYDSNIRNSMHMAALKDAKTAKYYYPPKTTIPLPTCFHNPSGYVCCNLKLNNVIEEAFQTLKTAEEFNPCNIGKMARAIQKKTQETFGHPFESIVALSDFAQNVHFAGDMVCKLEIDGKFMLAYATPYNADEVESIEEEGGGAAFGVRTRKMRRSLPIHTFRM